MIVMEAKEITTEVPPIIHHRVINFPTLRVR